MRRKKQFLHRAMSLPGTGLLFLVVFVFQNCGDPSTFHAARGVADLASTSIGGPGGTEPNHPVEPDMKVQETTYEPLLVDRYYLKSLFEDVFGTRAEAIESVNLFTDALNNGSPCSPYASHSVMSPNGARLMLSDPMENCSVASPAFHSAQVNPKPTVVRKALIMRACSDLTADDSTLKFALSKISSATVPERTNANVTKAFKLFYRGKPAPDQGLVDSLLLLVHPTRPTLDDWRSVLYTVCISPYWQVL